MQMCDGWKQYEVCQDRVFPFRPGFGSAPGAQTTREHRWRHIEHLLFECPCISGLDSSMAITLLRADLLRVCSAGCVLDQTNLWRCC